MGKRKGLLSCKRMMINKMSRISMMKTKRKLTKIKITWKF